MITARRRRPRQASRFVHRRAAHDPASCAHDDTLDIASEAAPRYLKWLADLCSPHLGSTVLEVGSGHGSVTQYLARGRSRFVATDLSEACLEILSDRFAHVDAIEVRKADVRELDLGETFDSIVMINVLEHIYDDAGVLARLRAHLNPGGSIVIYVPALNGVYGPHDREVGHFRRYSKWRIREVVREAGLNAAVVRYVNMLAIPAWVIYSLGGVGRPRSEGTRDSLQLWDRVAVPVVRGMESRVAPPVGLNLLCVARNDPRYE